MRYTPSAKTLPCPCLELVQLLSVLVESHNLTSQQSMLQTLSDLHHSDASLQLHRHLLTVQNSIHELIGLQGKCILEPLPVLRLNFVSHTELISENHVVLLRNNIDHQLSIRAGDLRADVVSVSLGPGTVKVRDLTAPKLNDADGVVHIGEILQLGMVLESTRCPAGFGNRVVEVPEGQIDIVNGAVDKYTAIARRIANEEAGFVAQVTSVGPNHERRSNSLLLEDLLACIAIRCIEAPREACHDFDRGVALGSIDDRLGL